MPLIGSPSRTVLNPQIFLQERIAPKGILMLCVLTCVSIRVCLDVSNSSCPPQHPALPRAPALAVVFVVLTAQPPAVPSDGMLQPGSVALLSPLAVQVRNAFNCFVTQQGKHSCLLKGLERGTNCCCPVAPWRPLPKLLVGIAWAGAGLWPHAVCAVGDVCAAAPWARAVTHNELLVLYCEEQRCMGLCALQSSFLGRHHFLSALFQN